MIAATAEASPVAGGLADAVAVLGLAAAEPGTGAGGLQLLLAAARAALADAGGAGRRPVAGVGLFIAQTTAPPPAGRAAAPAGQGILSPPPADLATALSSELDLPGPAVVVAGTAPAPLAALHEACGSLRHGGCQMALAGHAAGDRAGVLVLTRLGDALLRGDRIRAVIRATGEDGTPPPDDLPAPPGQAEADAWAVLAASLARCLDAPAPATREQQGAGAAGSAGAHQAAHAARREVIAKAEESAGSAAETGGASPAAWALVEEPPAPAPPGAPPPAPLRPRPPLANPYVPAADRLEEAIAGVWRELLGLDRVGAHDNFFELGGTSAIGLAIIARLEAWLHQEIPPLSLYDGPTVSALTRVLLHGAGRADGGYDAVRERGERRRRLRQGAER